MNDFSWEHFIYSWEFPLPDLMTGAYTFIIYMYIYIDNQQCDILTVLEQLKFGLYDSMAFFHRRQGTTRKGPKNEGSNFQKLW